MIKGINQTGFLFKGFVNKKQTPFEKLFEIFKELITYTSGDFDEAIDWLKELDKEFVLTSDDYTMDDFIDELYEKGFLKKQIDGVVVGNSMKNIHEQTIKSLSESLVNLG